MIQSRPIPLLGDPQIRGIITNAPFGGSLQKAKRLGST